MVTKCPACDDDNLICDFCKYFVDKENSRENYDYDGDCSLLKIGTSRIGSCNEFYCFKVDNLIEQKQQMKGIDNAI